MKSRTGNLLSILWFIFFSIFCHGKIQGQSDGLIFANHEVVSDLRTSLILPAQKSICVNSNFELSFDIQLLSGFSDYFGYVFRLVKEDGTNIDLISDFNPVVSNFKIIVANKISSIAFRIDTAKLFQTWTNLRFKFDTDRGQLSLVVGEKTYTEKKAILSLKNCFRLFFGSNQDKTFKTSDVCPMKIRNVAIYEKNILSYRWPLNEEFGNTVLEERKKANGTVKNPLWVRNEHSSWKFLKQLSLSGWASVAFNPGDESLSIVGYDSIYTFHLSGNEFTGNKYLSGRLDLKEGNQSIVNPYDGRLYNVFPDQNLVISFDPEKLRWSGNYSSAPIKDFWHVNKFFSRTDSSLYVAGGYGHHKYKNLIRRFHLPTQTWQQVSVKGDSLTPRYLAALGTNSSGDSAYILGGYGSPTGQQILNSQNLYDLLLFDVKNHRLKKLLNLKVGKEDFTFANSMVIDENSKTFYALTYPNDTYNSQLQLIKGSLNSPEFKAVGKKIPYHFHDINSFADLFYSPKSKKFLAVTIKSDEGKSVVSIYSLSGPPLELASAVTEKKKSSFPYLIIAISLLLISLLYIVIWRYVRKKEKINVGPASFLPREGSLQTASGATLLPVADREPQNSAYQQNPNQNELQPHNSIFFFGELQIYDENGEDITKYLTPLLKELFLLIFMYTIKQGRGVSSGRLNEVLWFNKDEKSARNNRSVNIAKLKNILEKVGNTQVIKSPGYCKIEIDYTKVSIDYVKYLNIVRDKTSLNKEKVLELIAITQKGSFLSDTEYEWLDPFKSEVSNEVINYYLQVANSMKIPDDPEFLVTLANYIFYFDPVNEDAMILKCKALSYLGKHSLAKNAFETFTRVYKNIYGEDFTRDFNEIISD